MVTMASDNVNTVYDTEYLLRGFSNLLKHYHETCTYALTYLPYNNWRLTANFPLIYRYDNNMYAVTIYMIQSLEKKFSLE